MRLPIYRKLDERLQILGLNLLELGCLGGLYVLLAEALSFWSYGFLFSLLVSAIGFVFLTILHQKFESHFLQKWLRFAKLPEALPKMIFVFPERKA